MNDAIRPKLCRLIENKFGSEIRSSKHCLRLSLEISRNTGRNISCSTLARLFRLFKRSGNLDNNLTNPRLETLDVISNYLGYKNWDYLMPELSDPKTEN